MGKVDMGGCGATSHPSRRVPNISTKPETGISHCTVQQPKKGPKQKLEGFLRPPAKQTRTAPKINLQQQRAGKLETADIKFVSKNNHTTISQPPP